MLNNFISKITNETELYDSLNIEKSLILEAKKPSTKTPILYFLEKDLNDIPNGFSKISEDILYSKDPLFEKRSLLEYIPMQRHPIPYVVIRYNDMYFLIFRENGSGEMRLIGKKGLLGGHIDDADSIFANDSLDIKATIKKGMLRELQEEAGITEDNIVNTEFVGFIKIEEPFAVENDHLGLVYLIDINTADIKAEEDGILSGGWFSKEDIVKNIDSLEKWSNIAFRKIFDL